MDFFIVLILIVGNTLAIELTCVRKGNDIKCTSNGNADRTELVQGDMLFNNETEEEHFGRNAIRTGHWPGGVIPYTFDLYATNEEAKLVLKAMETIMNNTCVKFVPWTGDGPTAFISREKNGCYSNVGYSLDANDKVIINLSPSGCFYSNGVITHELLHLIGLHHEQSRPDRDKYVTILWDNIEKTPSDMSYNFNKYSSNDVTTLGLPYDYKSVMHYENDAFSIDGKLPTIVHKTKPSMKLGQMDEPTELDFKKVRKLYKC